MTGRLLPAVFAAGLLAGCATTFDEEIASRVSADSTTTTTVFVARGSTEELLDLLLAEAHDLSEAIVDNQGQGEIVARIDVIWDAARPGVEKLAPGLLLEFDRAMVMLHTAVDRRRPADADKAATNLVNLIAAVQG